MHADIVHLTSKLAKIEGAHALGEKLLEIVNAKQIAEVAAPKTKSSEETPEEAPEEIPEKTESAGDKQDSEKEADSSSS